MSEHATMRGPKDFRLVDGTVIDHLPAGTASEALRLLGLPRDGAVTIGMNVPSQRIGRKDIVRVEGLYLSKGELDRLSLLGTSVTVSIVQGGDVTSKTELTVPERLIGVLTCRNPTCITNDERVPSVFVRLPGTPIRLRCHYCERVVS